MTLTSSIQSASSESNNPTSKSFYGCNLHIELRDVGEIRGKKYPFPTELRGLLHEFSDKEPIRQVVILTNKSAKMGRLTTFQIKEMFNDMGFNVDPVFSGAHHADFEAVMNINGYSIPGWVKVVRVISLFLPSYEKVLLRKISPGRDRLHLRFFESNDGTWMIAAHTDFNWLSLNLPRVYKAHISSGMGMGSGDYVTGTVMLYSLLKEFNNKLLSGKTIKEKDISRVLNRSYNQSLADKFRS